ncbi:hypothetical protein PoB_004145900 [Plakobranchus ocellatus]|uniref:Uncharacterized protein n=1 Tax=Plakobranchus ocellatus TaxID=259542 RepID=A0AAV4B9C9_9GAST|nr:hypothetical protein PoB_004145900 [Plakobranchus ocellatus]
MDIQKERIRASRCKISFTRRDPPPYGQAWKPNPEQGVLRFSGPPSGQGASGGARTRDRRVPADLRADSLYIMPPTPQA